MDFKTVYKEESYGYLNFGLDIQVATSIDIDIKQKSIQNALYKAAEIIKNEILAAMNINNPNIIKTIKENRKLISLFPKPIFVEEIPNEYSDDWYYRVFPWFIITTNIGRIKIGWRKRVININWTETTNTNTAHELFANENTTKGIKYIHAWSMEKAKYYIETILKGNNCI